jgi:hypothetical protein
LLHAKLRWQTAPLTVVAVFDTVLTVDLTVFATDFAAAVKLLKIELEELLR